MRSPQHGVRRGVVRGVRRGVPLRIRRVRAQDIAEDGERGAVAIGRRQALHPDQQIDDGLGAQAWDGTAMLPICSIAVAKGAIAGAARARSASKRIGQSGS